VGQCNGAAKASRQGPTTAFSETNQKHFPKTDETKNQKHYKIDTSKLKLFENMKVKNQKNYRK
jgi:hypothetical protein